MGSVLITVCARGGSKGIPGKNIKLINGQPLIAYTLKTAEEFAGKTGNTDIILSTDDEDIKKTVAKLSLLTHTDYLRPQYLATDAAGKLDTIVAAKNYAEATYHKVYDYVIDLDVTSPLRNCKDLQDAKKLLDADEEAYNIFSVSPANRNPYFNMVEEQENGYFALSKKGSFLTRQSAPKVYDMNASFYIFKKSFFEGDFKTVLTDKSLVYEVPHLCFDLDHAVDFEWMAFLLENRKLDFDFNY